MNHKRILEIITLPGSAEAFIGDQFSYFQQEGDYEMHLICSDGDGLAEFAKRQHIKYQPVEISRQLAPWKDIKAIFQIARYIRKNHIDLIVAHYFPKASLIATLGGTLSLHSDSSYSPILRTLRSIAAIDAIGHSGAIG